MNVVVSTEQHIHVSPRPSTVAVVRARAVKPTPAPLQPKNSQLNTVSSQLDVASAGPPLVTTIAPPVERSSTHETTATNIPKPDAFNSRAPTTYLPREEDAREKKTTVVDSSEPARNDSEPIATTPAGAEGPKAAKQKVLYFSDELKARVAEREIRRVEKRNAKLQAIKARVAAWHKEEVAATN
uniref:Uncharacterized protein n=1 Tax=Mycena chlorophos TaxID=658473 RepID=A0ABQ0MAY0_MYCCL|nr:predicted protein [Mycena chlorophos]